MWGREILCALNFVSEYTEGLDFPNIWRKNDWGRRNWFREPCERKWTDQTVSQKWQRKRLVTHGPDSQVYSGFWLLFQERGVGQEWSLLQTIHPRKHSFWTSEERLAPLVILKRLRQSNATWNFKSFHSSLKYLPSKALQKTKTNQTWILCLSRLWCGKVKITH